MKIRELIERLAEYDPDMEVVGRGYEGGYDDVALSKVWVFLNRNSTEDGSKIHWYEGLHEGADSTDEGATEVLCL